MIRIRIETAGALSGFEFFEKRNAQKVFADPEIKKNFLERQYFESITGTPEQLTKYIKAEEPKWRRVIHDAKVKGE